MDDDYKRGTSNFHLKFKDIKTVERIDKLVSISKKKKTDLLRDMINYSLPFFEKKYNGEEVEKQEHELLDQIIQSQQTIINKQNLLLKNLLSEDVYLKYFDKLGDAFYNYLILITKIACDVEIDDTYKDSILNHTQPELASLKNKLIVENQKRINEAYKNTLEVNQKVNQKMDEGGEE